MSSSTLFIRQMWHSILPEGNCLPTSYRSAYKIIKPYLVPEMVFHACVNDCVLFRGDYKENVTCPKCNEPRFKRNNIPRRTFHYLPLGARLARSFGAKDISYLLQSHGGGGGNHVQKLRKQWMMFMIPQSGRRHLGPLAHLRVTHGGLHCRFVLTVLIHGVKTKPITPCGPLSLDN